MTDEPLDDLEPTAEELASAAALAGLLDGSPDVTVDRAQELVAEREVVGLLAPVEHGGIDLDQAWARVARRAPAAQTVRRASWTRWAVAASIAFLAAVGAVIAMQLGAGRGPLPPEPTAAMHRAAVSALAADARTTKARVQRLGTLQALADAQRRRLIAEIHDG